MIAREETTWAEELIEESNIKREDQCIACLGTGDSASKDHFEFFNKCRCSVPCPECDGTGLNRKDDNEQGNG
jgi:hypothetical protein